MDRNRCCRNRPLRVDQLFEAFLPQQLAIDDARRADLDDFVTTARVQPGGFGVEHRIGELSEPPVGQCAAGLAGLEQIEVVILGPAAEREQFGRVELFPLARQRQQEAEEGTVTHPLALEPEFTAVPFHHVAHRQRRAFAAADHVVHLPAHDGFGAHGLALPDQVEVGPPGLRRATQTQAHAADVVLVGQPLGQRGQRLQQRKAVHLEPQRTAAVIAFFDPGAQPPRRVDAPLRRRQQVFAQHVFQRPARLDAFCGVVGQRVQARAHRADLVADHRLEALAHRRFEVGQVEHVDRRLHAGERRAAAFGQREQQRVARRLFFELTRDVVQHQHETGDRSAVAVVRRTGDCRHLGAQQLAGARGGDELRRRTGHAALPALLDVLQRVRHALAVEHGVDRAPEADQFGARGNAGRIGQRAELQPGARVVQQDAAVEVAHHDALRQFRHQRGEPAALLLDRAARLPHLLCHVGAQSVALLRQRKDDLAQRAVVGCAVRGRRACRVGAEQRAGFFEQARRRFDVMAHQRVEAGCNAEQHEQQRQAAQRRHAVGKLSERAAAGRRQRRPDQGGGDRRPQQHDAAQGSQRQQHAPIRPVARIHAVTSSRAFACCSSARVGQGLVR